MPDAPIDFFDERTQEKIVDLLSSAYDSAISMERKRQSNLSPGIVEDHEQLAHQIHSPHQIDVNGEIKPAAFDQFMGKGLSVHRMSHTSVDQIHHRGYEKAKKDRERNAERAYQGFTSIECGKVREVLDFDNIHRVFGVYDTALPLWSDHADIFLIRPKKMESEGAPSKDFLKRQRRKKLWDLFGPLVKAG